MYSIGVPYLNRFEKQHQEAALRALEEVGCAEWAHVTIAEMPFGVAKRVDLARALAGEPSVLLLDEPAAGLGHAERLRLAEVVSRLISREHTILLVEHDMGFVARVCRRLVVLHAGRVIYDGHRGRTGRPGGAQGIPGLGSHRGGRRSDRRSGGGRWHYQPVP